MTAFGIRAATIGDAERMAEIAKGNPTAPQWSTAEFCEMLTPVLLPRPLVRGGVVFQNGSTVDGFAVASVLTSVFPVEAELESLAVAAGQHGRGIGRHLLAEILWWATCRRAGTMRLEVRTSNERALQLYTRCGFQQTGVRPGYYTAPAEDAVVMERTRPIIKPRSAATLA